MSWLIDNKELVAGIVGFIWFIFWTWFRTTEWYRKSNAEQIEKGRQALEDLAKVAVNRTYQEKVKEIKDESVKAGGDGSVGDRAKEVQSYALSVLKQEATDVLKTKGVDVMAQFAESFIKAKIEEAYRAQKSEGMATKG